MSLLFSSQTKDEANSACIKRFQKAKMANAEKCSKAEISTLEKLITPVSFYKTKAKNLKIIAEICYKNYNDDDSTGIPDNLEELVQFPGIGYKMGHLIMKAAFDEITGIAVDVHVHRTVNRLKWFDRVIEKPNDMMVALQNFLPKEHWAEINFLMVGFGQQRCFAKNPKCEGCLNRAICPGPEKKK